MVAVSARRRRPHSPLQRILLLFSLPLGGATYRSRERERFEANITRGGGADSADFRYLPGRGVVIIGDGCFVPVAFTSALMLQQHGLHLPVALFTSAEGIGTARKLERFFRLTPFERVVDATDMLDRHEPKFSDLARNRTCAFRLQKIIAHIYAPYYHSLIIDADNFPCSPRILKLFDAHDAADTQALLMYDPTRPGVWNGGFQLAKRTPPVRRAKDQWLRKVARSCRTGIHMRKVSGGVNYVLDQPDMNYVLSRWPYNGNYSTPIGQIPHALEACRPEMWGKPEERERYLRIVGQPGNEALLDAPPCPFAHINPFKFPWLMQERVDKFCFIKGFGATSDVLYRVLEVAFNDTSGLGLSRGTATWCLKQVRATAAQHDISPHFIDGR